MNLWMRWVNFRALRDLLLLVGDHPDGLRANELERLATDECVLRRRDGRPHARSTHYHHRRTLEKLGLLGKQGHNLVLNSRSPEIGVLTERARLRQRLQPSEKEAFANAILRDKDCHDSFFENFLLTPEPAGDVSTFVEQAHPIEMRVLSEHEQEARLGLNLVHHDLRSGSRRVAIRTATGTDWHVLEGANAVQAIHFGLRSWCVDQLGFLDFVYRADGTFTMFPRHIVAQVTDRVLAAEMFSDLEFIDGWATIRIPDCALAVGVSHRVSVEQAKGVLADWLKSHPDLVAGLPTRLEFITAGLPDRQHALALKSYLRSDSGAYVSHVRIHEMLRQHVQNGDSVP